MNNVRATAVGCLSKPDRRFIVAACTAVADRPMFARLNLLQVQSQTVRPHYHSVVASGLEFDCRTIEDLLDDVTLFTCLPPGQTTLDCYTLSMKELYARGANLFLCLDHDCVYKRRYIEHVCESVSRAGVDVEKGDFCINLVDQQWITLYDDARVDVNERSFRGGFGAPADEKPAAIGAPPTFVFGRAAAALVIERAEAGGRAANGYHDGFWRRALAEGGIEITVAQTPEPVFAYVRHSNNFCWGGKPVGCRPEPEKAVVAPSRDRSPAPKPASPRKQARHLDTVDVSVIIPTYNEGEWLARTVESIRAAETDLRYEIVVVDDGCTDGSIASLVPGDDLRTVETGGSQLGLIVAKNAGAKAARGRYVCFLDSHALVNDHWLDSQRQTCDAFPEGALVTGNLPDFARRSDRLDLNQYGYVIRNCLLGTGWHHYGHNRMDRPYVAPLTPGGLMFTRKLHFAKLGGFEPTLRKWGAEDVQISLRNYYMGGDNVVDPRVVAYHYYKGGKKNKRTFSVTSAQHWFNCLHVASVYFPREYYLKVRQAIVSRSATTSFVAEIESDEYQRRILDLQCDFVRGFDEWTSEFATELKRFLDDAEQQAPSRNEGAPDEEKEEALVAVAL